MSFREHVHQPSASHQSMSRGAGSKLGSPTETAPQKPSGLVARLGPGVISGAANDDPSCIVTYSMAGAAFGYLTLWVSLFTLPLIASVQLMCSRLGMLGGRGLAGAVRKNYPP